MTICCNTNPSEESELSPQFCAIFFTRSVDGWVFDLASYVSFSTMNYLVNSVADLGQRHRSCKKLLERYLLIFHEGGHLREFEDMVHVKAQFVVDAEWEELEDFRTPLRYDALENKVRLSIAREQAAVRSGKAGLGNLLRAYRTFWREQENERVLKVLEDIVHDSILNRTMRSSSLKKRKRETYEMGNKVPVSNYNEPQLVANLVAPFLSQLNELHDPFSFSKKYFFESSQL